MTAIILSLCLALPPAQAQELNGPSLSVVFFTPASLPEHPFWQRFTGFLRAAAEDLDIDLTVVESANHFLVLDNARLVAKRVVRPDYALYIHQAKITVDMLPILEDAGIRSVICNTDVIDSEREEMGRPRGKYKSWIGHIFPDDLGAGRESAEMLIAEGIALGLTGRDGRLHMAGIGGIGNVAPDAHRMQGLKNAVADNPLVVLDRLVKADWQRDKARYKTMRMLDMYADARVYWATNDGMALGALEAAEKHGLTPGKNFLAGGLGWTPQGIRAIREGRLEASYGGHFMEGAWALIMILDHHNGLDFAPPSPTIISPMRRIDQNTMETYLPILDQGNWKRIDFKRFSKTHNPGLKAYDFTPEAVLRQLAGK
jgi:ABC-type sugar transport system substrate-binding protein